MFGKHIKHHLLRRSLIQVEAVSTSTAAVIYATSASLSSPVAESTTLEPATSTTSQSTLTSKPTTKTLTTTTQITTTSQLPTSTPLVQQPSPTTSTSPPPPPPPSPLPPPPPPPPPSPPPPPPLPPTSPPSQPSPQPTTTQDALQEAPHGTNDAPPQEVVVVKPTPVSPTSNVDDTIPTAFGDLPLSIQSPTVTAPKSIPLLVATSSTPALFVASSSATHSFMVTSTASPVASETALPAMSGMTAQGKVSLIFGIVLLLGAGCIMSQLYFKKKRQARKVTRLQDNEKQSFGGLDMSLKKNLKIQSQPSLSNSKVGLTLTSTSETRSLKENSRANPFGNHAEVLVDSVNASGPEIIEKLGSEQAQLTRGTSKISLPFKPGAGELPATSSPSVQNLMPQEIGTTSPSAAVPIGEVNQALTRPASGVYRVQLDFTPSMNDELELRTGQLIRVLHEFDDGWAMCVRLDCSEQGVCPRTCLSNRPLKPRSPSAGVSVRPTIQMPQNCNTKVNPKEFAPLPMLPNEQFDLSPGSLHKSASENSQPPVPDKNTISQPSNIPSDPSPSSLPIKNAARYVSLTLQSSDAMTPQSLAELSGSSAPGDDYFSFTKTLNEQTSENTNPDHLHSPTLSTVGGEIGIPANLLSQRPSSSKSVPGQAL